MLILKQVNVDLDDAYGYDLQGFFKRAFIQVAMIKGANKAESW